VRAGTARAPSCHHIVREFQMSEAWVLRAGAALRPRAVSLESRAGRPEPVRILGRPRHLIWRVARQHLRVARARMVAAARRGVQEPLVPQLSAGADGGGTADDAAEARRRLR
jgi:hypothetical protein